MPNARRDGQTFIGFQADADLLSEIDSARQHTSRSQFIREAVALKLRSLGIDVGDALIYPPDRTRVKIANMTGGVVVGGNAHFAGDADAGGKPPKKPRKPGK